MIEDLSSSRLAIWGKLSSTVILCFAYSIVDPSKVDFGFSDHRDLPFSFLG